ncbi:MAG TPA: hypothetical protein VFL55_22040 [Acetobacteraceae bacterium]|nr:hypothetical protein [Acetobacteraceae bacterium]
MVACDRAAKRAEAEWHLPAGLLSAIGVVESGRSGLGHLLPVVWPWTINAGGHGRYFADTAAALATVHALQASGTQMIDVGCFQVDLFYHPQAFASLAAAFDPDANAQAAARILVQSRLSSGSWESAIALYHSASPLRGGAYFQHVQAVWPQARARGVAAQDANYATLLSPAARAVRVIAWDDLPGAGLPRVLGVPTNTVVQWTSIPAADLPKVLLPTK